MLLAFQTVSHVVVTLNQKIILLLLYNSAPVMNLNVNIYYGTSKGVVTHRPGAVALVCPLIGDHLFTS